MAKTYRDVAIEQIILTVEEAMSRTIDWWGDLPAPMNEAIERVSCSTRGGNRFRRVCKKGAGQTGTRNALIDERLPNDRDLGVLGCPVMEPMLHAK
jgi:hypothetical protein